MPHCATPAKPTRGSVYVTLNSVCIPIKHIYNMVTSNGKRYIMVSMVVTSSGQHRMLCVNCAIHIHRSFEVGCISDMKISSNAHHFYRNTLSHGLHIHATCHNGETLDNAFLKIVLKRLDGDIGPVVYCELCWRKNTQLIHGDRMWWILVIIG